MARGWLTTRLSAQPRRASIPVPIRLVSVGSACRSPSPRAPAGVLVMQYGQGRPGRLVTAPARRRSIWRWAGKDADRHLSRAAEGASSPVMQPGQRAGGACAVACGDGCEVRGRQVHHGGQMPILFIAERRQRGAR